MQLNDFICQLPKAELNVHFEGILEPAHILALAKRNNIALPYTTVDEIKRDLQFHDLSSFMTIYYKLLQVLVTEEDFYEATLAYLQKATTQSIRHVELSFNPQAHLSRGIAFPTIIEGIHRALLEGEKNLKISSHLILCFKGNLPEEEAQKVFTLALPYKDWIVAIGLDALEESNPPEKFLNVFAKARENGFLTVATAGEFDPPEYIAQALDALKACRIDHGVRCMEDPDILTKLSASQIPLGVCPISNVKLGLFPNMRAHPVKKMYEEGLCVTINSDYPAFFDAYLNENFIALNAALKLNKTIIYEFAKNSFTASFLDHDKKEKLINELEKFFKKASMNKG